MVLRDFGRDSLPKVASGTFDHIHRVIPIVILNDGEASGVQAMLDFLTNVTFMDASLEYYVKFVKQLKNWPDYIWCLQIFHDFVHFFYTEKLFCISIYLYIYHDPFSPGLLPLTQSGTSDEQVMLCSRRLPRRPSGICRQRSSLPFQ